MIKKFDIIKSSKRPDFRAGLLLRGDDDGTAGGGSRAEAEAEAVGN